MTKAKRIIAKFIIYAILLLGGLVCLYPLVFTVMAGFFSAAEFSTTVSLFPIPKNPTLENYIGILSLSGDMGIYFLNSCIRTVYSAAWAIVTCFLAGYCFARLNFTLKRFWFMMLLLASMLPSTMLIIPTYIMYARWPFTGGNMIFTGGSGILDTFWVYLISGPSINIMGAFLVKQSIDQIPKSLDESAKIDGAGHFTIIFKILLRLCVPIMIFVGVTTAIAIWNDWGTSYFFTSNPALQTLPGALSRLSSKLNNLFDIPNYPLIISMSLVLTIPSLIIFFIFQRYIVEGIAFVGIKG